MRYLAFALVLVGVVTAARALDAIPDLKGTWSGKGQSIVFGHNPHHPGSQAVDSPPRVRASSSSAFVVDGQDGRPRLGSLVLDHVAITNERFAQAISADNKSDRRSQYPRQLSNDRNVSRSY